MRKFYEFFAGGGMVRAGLGDGWFCSVANDFDHKKAEVYRANWGLGCNLIEGDVREVRADDLPDTADLAWASFPCQDLSLAGGGAGLKGDRSGTFWPFWKLMGSLVDDQRGPKVIVLENVCGTLSSHKGEDFKAIGAAFAARGYRFGAVVIDAALFVPQSRPRLFVIGVRGDVRVPDGLASDVPTGRHHTRGLRLAYEKLTPKSKRAWFWWNLPMPDARCRDLIDCIEADPADVDWHTSAETDQLLGMMSPINREKVDAALKTKRRMAGAVYKRTRRDENGVKVQRAEVRFDGVAGCLRTPAGGSSRQLIVLVEDGQVRSRLISGRESARLMGLPEDYELPRNRNEAYHLTGDGVAVPVVRFLASHLLEPLTCASDGDGWKDHTTTAAVEQKRQAAVAL